MSVRPRMTNLFEQLGLDSHPSAESADQNYRSGLLDRGAAPVFSGKNKI